MQPMARRKPDAIKQVYPLFREIKLSGMPWYQSDPNRLPDSDFEPGELHHPCVGNEGRLLDFRRTPVRVEKLSDETGLATLQILAFEDKGALWDLPYEEVGRYQFKKDSAKASPEALAGIKVAVTRFNHELVIPPEGEQREQTLQAIAHERKHARTWLLQHSRFVQSGASIPDGAAEGLPLLIADTKSYMAERRLLDLEALFPRQYVSNFYNEAVKAHRIAIAELGLAPYRGKILRNPLQTSGALSLDRRKNHVILRMGLVQAIFQLCGLDHVVLYRMESCEGPLRPRNTGTVLVSASFRLDIVKEMSGWPIVNVQWPYIGNRFQ